jgi:FkbM family methyltransferase
MGRLFAEKVIRKVNGSWMLLSRKEMGIHRDLLLHGKREVMPTDYLMKGEIVKEGDIVLDIGANIGYYVLIESKLVGEAGKVYAVEPVSKNLDLLMKNIKLNNRENIEVFHLAMDKKNGRSKVYISEESNLSSMKINSGRNIIGEEEIDVLKVDTFLEGKETPNFIRMDVEGYEYNIIKGMKETLKKDIKLFIEIHGHLLTKDQSNEIVDKLKENNFNVDVCSTSDCKFSLNKVAQFLLAKLEGEYPSVILNVDIEKLRGLLVKRKMCVHIFFSKRMT